MTGPTSEVKHTTTSNDVLFFYSQHMHIANELLNIIYVCIYKSIYLIIKVTTKYGINS